MSEQNRYRNKEIRVKVSESEYVMICEKAIESGLTVSDAIRSLIVFGSIKPNRLDDKSQEKIEKLNSLIEKSVYELNRIGNNVNQIAYNTNSRYFTELGELEIAKDEMVKAYNLFIESIEEMRDVLNADNTYSQSNTDD